MTGTADADRNAVGEDEARKRAGQNPAPREDGPPLRWMAEITYATGRLKTSFEEFENLVAIIKSGPDWGEIDKIVITPRTSG